MSSGSSRVKARWCLPHAGFVKINVDAALNRDYGRVGLGLVARNENGEVIQAMACTLLHEWSAEQAEAAIVLWATKVAIEQAVVITTFTSRFQWLIWIVWKRILVWLYSCCTTWISWMMRIEFLRICLQILLDLMRPSVCDFLKEIGNSLFKVTGFRKAYETYMNAMKCLCVTISAMYEECSVHNIDIEIRELVVSQQLNIAACEIKLSLFKEDIGSCSLVLEVDKSNVKALFRRGVALTKIGSMEDGYTDFRIAIGVEPKSKAIAQEIASLEAVLFQVSRVDDVVDHHSVIVV
ncbi:hypothetical protein BVRB_1g010660 [Beta vulgaris subsp. vulgaris]|nr:hypothetical protein BVRB_1g010660 [Beta vulgaris subsp. vulgaris]